MSRPTSTEQFQTGDWERLQETAEQFERAWRERTDVDLISFLPPADDPLYGAILEELVKIDLEIRRTHEQTVTLDYYLEKYPQLGNAQTVSARLIYEEYRVLCRFGGTADPEPYRQRFPKQFEELRRLIDQQSLPADSDTRSDSSLHTGKPRAAMFLQNGEVLPVGEGYRLIECMGEGTFGEVWKVEAPGGFPAAIKIVRRTLDSEESKREQRALVVIKRLSHPHLLKTQAAWASQDRLVILMDLADGTLRDRLRECKATGASGIAPGELFRYFQEAAEALDYLHSEGVLHRDVKPQNLLLCKGHVKVADFGLIRDENQHQRSYSAAGTPGYMAPESWRGSPCAAGDQYSLALTYAELRLGRWPFDATDPMNVMLAHVEGTPDLSRLEQAEQAVVLQAMAKKPAERFADCQAFVAALRDAMPDVPIGPNRTVAIRPLGATPTQGMPRIESKMARPKAFVNKGMGDLPSEGTMLPFDRSDEGVPPPDGSTAQVQPRRAGGEERAASMSWQAAPKPRRSRFGWIEAVILVLAVAGAALWFVKRPSSSASLPQIVRHVSGQDVVFKLIQPAGQPDEPFYLMENKVSNAVFRAFDHEERLDDNTKWHRGGVKDSGDVGDFDDFPVLRVTRSEAERCAAWLGGSLPTARQLDLAFGQADPPKTAAVNRIRLGPRKIMEPHDDISLFGIRDLAGNGREWTSDNLTIQGKTFALLRGRSYAAPGPLLPIHLDEWKAQPELSPTQSADYPSPYTGFRVALPLSAATQK